ncbi:MAG: hypothetical protein ABSF77_10765 [Spirochaetia bacterium]
MQPQEPAGPAHPPVQPRRKKLLPRPFYLASAIVLAVLAIALFIVLLST